jgi:hypothetical protein
MDEVGGGLVTLECLGDTPGLRFLDGHTADGTVGLAPSPAAPFTGASWRLADQGGGAFTLASQGDVAGSRFLDGRTADGTVGLAPNGAPPFTGARWRAHVVPPTQVLTLECLGDVAGPPFLDGRTADATVGLAPGTGSPFSGTRWALKDDGNGVVTLECLGEVPGPRFLEGREDGTAGLAAPSARSRWQRRDQDGAVTFECLGVTAGSRFLDGRTASASVGLAPGTGPAFTGTRWRTRISSILVNDHLAPTAGDVLAVHAALMPTGQIVYFGGDEHDRGEHDRNDVDHTRLFDCATFETTNPGSPTSDVFCCGHALLEDGSLLVAGGTEVFLLDQPGEFHQHHFPGLHDVWAFDPFAQTWRRLTSMSSAELERFREAAPGPGDPGGRWYPTLVSLAGGDVLAVSGHPSIHDSRHNNHTPERFSPGPGPAGSWTLLSEPGPEFEGTEPPRLYPRLHLLPNGQVFCSSPIGSVSQSQLIDPATGARAPAGAAPPDPINLGTFFSQDGSSVLLPLLPSDGYRPRVLLCGAHQPVVMDLQPLLDNPAARPGWAPTAARQLAAAPPRFTVPNPPRFHLNAVLLPTGDVLVCGGCAAFRSDAAAVLEPELYHPARAGRPDSWETLPAATVPRNYHSVAVLMPDGRVWTAGSNHDGQQGRQNLEPRIEILEPPYFGKPNRPQISAAPASILPGTQFSVATPQAASIDRVAVLRASSVTHAFSSDQRYVVLDFTLEAGQLTVQAPPNNNIVPPGYYLLYIVDSAGLPSEGFNLQITTGP